MPVTYNTAAGDLTIGGIAMFCPAWKITNLYELWLPADQRGQDVTRPGVAGSYAVKRYNTATRKSLRMIIVGDVDRTGASSSSKLAGIYTNIAYLRDNVVAPTGTTDGTRSAVLTVPGGTTITEPIHVTGLEVSDLREDGGWVKAVLEISIPSGRFQ
jgi:hypothetical protein